MKTLSRFLLGLIFLLAAVINGSAQNKNDTLSIEKALSTYSINQLLFSPDGTKAIAEVSQKGAGANLPASHLWLVDVASKTIRQFTNSLKSETNARWSPNGKQLAFVSARDGDAQVYILETDGGEAWPLTKSTTGINAFEWSPNGKTIAYLADEAATAAEKKREDDKYDEVVVSESQKPSIIFFVDVETKKETALAKQNWEIDEMQWAPSGDKLLLVTQKLPLAEIPMPQLVQWSIKDSVVTILPSPKHSFWGNIKISPDGNSIAYLSARIDGPDSHDLFIQSLTSGEIKNITAKNLDLPIRDMKFLDNHRLLALAQKGFTPKLYTVKDDGTVAAFTSNDNIGNFDIATTGNLLFIKVGADVLPEVWLTTADKKTTQVSHFNKIFDSVNLATPKMLTYKSFDGTTIEAALYKPTVVSDKALPLVVFIHGGPTGAFVNSYNAWIQLFVQKGYAVFCPNIRGSSGYGWNFLIANRYDWGGGDFKDVMAGVDMLVAKENIDSTRMGISGWSYGGYMAEWAITQTNRFKAAVSGAGLSNLASEFGTESNAAYDNWFLGTPYENMEKFNKQSAITFIKNAKTPTLIIQGEKDRTDPVGQSTELYRGLRFYNVPTELVLYPREPHGFREIKHSIDFYSRMLAWFDKYVK